MPAKRFALTVISARTALIALAIATFFATSASAQSTQGSKRVLIVFTHQSDNPAQATVEESLRSTLQTKSTVPVEMYSEYLDAVRTPLDNYEKELVAQLQQKYAGKNFDLIFAVNPPALKLLLQNRATLFPSSPIVFLVLDQQNLNGLNDGPNLTGVWGEVNYKATLELALNLHPATRQVVVISGVGEWDNYWRSVVQQELRPFEGRVVFSYLTGLTVAELQKSLAGLPPQTIVLFVSSTKDREGNNPGNLAVVRQICPVSSAPVYGNSDAQVGLGIVGGKVVSFEALGLEAAQVGLRVMNGEKPGAIAPHGIASVPMFDSRELKRWGIKESNLPPGAIVKFKQVSLWENYKWTIIGLIAAVILEGLLILQLLNADRKRRRAEQKTKRADTRLRDIVSNVPGIVWETVIDPKTKQRKTTFVSDAVKTVLGYTPQEWLAEPPGFGARIMAEEDREQATNMSDQAIASGKDAVSQFRWRAKDGRSVWIETHLRPILGQNGAAEGLRGVSLDITERKLAEEKSRALLEAVPDLMFLQSRDGVYLDYHCKDPQDLFLPPESFLGKNVRDVMPPQLAAKVLTGLKQTANRAEPYVFEYELPIQGKNRWYEARMVPTGDNVLTLVRDVTERKTAESALRESEERSRRAQQAARVGTWEWDVRTGNSVWSDMIWDLLGLKKEEGATTLERFVERIHRDDRDRTLQKVRALLASGNDEYYDEFRVVRPTEEVVWLSSSGRLFRGSDGTPERMIGVNVDITKRKLAEETAQETQEKEKAILNAIPDLMFLQTRDGVYLDYHATDKENLLIPPEQYLGKNMGEILPPELAKKFEHYFQRAVETGETQIVEYALMLRDGEHWFESRLVTSGANILSVVRDITQRKRSLDQLRASEERFAKAFRSNPQPMSISIMADGVYIDVNDSFLAMSEYSREEIIGYASLALGVWVEPEKRREFMEQLVHRGSLSNVETVFRTKAGSRRVLLSSAERVEIGGQDCVLITSSDITERMAAQQALRESEARYRQMAEAAARAHEELVVAHEEVQRLKDQLEEENIYLQEEVRLAKNFGEMVGESDAIKYVMFKVNHVAVTDSTVLITGETGTGKELVARAIHSASARSDRPLITINCAALPPTLIESELFGHEKGAFTGAAARKPGRFELADGGTIFLDEIGELPLESQVKLLRVIQEGEVQRLGGSNPIKVNVRIIAATNRNLKREIELGAFREDLWYRLNVFPITVPPLRQRREDIPLLVEHFVANYANKFGKTITSITPQAMQMLVEHSWPGNVRELANVIERAVIYTHGAVLNPVDIFEQPKQAAADSSAMKSLEEVEREYILHILEHTSWRIEGPHGAAKLLGMNPSTLRTRMIKLGIHKNNSNVNSH